MNRLFIRNNITSFSIILFVSLFVAIHMYQPQIMYDKTGALRDFGIGYKHKTILPVWLFSILLAFLSYLFVLHYLAIPKIYR